MTSKRARPSSFDSNGVSPSADTTPLALDRSGALRAATEQEAARQPPVGIYSAWRRLRPTLCEGRRPEDAGWVDMTDAALESMGVSRRTAQVETGIWIHPGLALTVIESMECAPDGRCWLHISASRKPRLGRSFSDEPPTWTQMSIVKRVFVGPLLESYMIHPPSERYVNHHPGVLHWWTCVDPEWLAANPDGAVLPRFETRVPDDDPTTGAPSYMV